ncbi:MAG TPA: hypothetical protein VLM37_01595 [Fibrobacteraceae bacterium]|nr:hypothetical protein [Fibrobacteraceae bacterium]
MKSRLKKYLAHVQAVTAERRQGAFSAEQRDAQLRDLLIQIRFFQHERLVHLLVTLVVSVLFVAVTLYLSYAPSLPVLAVQLLLLVLTVAYILHYFVLENGVQKLYQVYDEWRNL